MLSKFPPARETAEQEAAGPPTTTVSASNSGVNGPSLQLAEEAAPAVAAPPRGEGLEGSWLQQLQQRPNRPRRTAGGTFQRGTIHYLKW